MDSYQDAPWFEDDTDEEGRSLDSIEAICADELGWRDEQKSSFMRLRFFESR